MRPASENKHFSKTRPPRAPLGIITADCTIVGQLPGDCSGNGRIGVSWWNCKTQLQRGGLCRDGFHLHIYHRTIFKLSIKGYSVIRKHSFESPSFGSLTKFSESCAPSLSCSPGPLPGHPLSQAVLAVVGPSMNGSAPFQSAHCVLCCFIAWVSAPDHWASFVEAS